MLLTLKWGHMILGNYLVKEVILAKDYSNCLGVGVCDGPRVTKSFKVMFEKTNSREMIQQRWKLQTY